MLTIRALGNKQYQLIYQDNYELINYNIADIVNRRINLCNIIKESLDIGLREAKNELDNLLSDDDHIHTFRAKYAPHIIYYPPIYSIVSIQCNTTESKSINSNSNENITISSKVQRSIEQIRTATITGQIAIRRRTC